MTTIRQIDSAARKLVEQLSRSDRKLVLAESCTGGLVAASLTRVPGVSHFFCGSAVTYRLETKSAWLRIPPKVVQRSDAVTRTVAVAMATQVLLQTPEATIAAAITGHLGPGAPRKLDGLIFVAVALRSNVPSETPVVTCRRYRLHDSASRPKKAPLDATAGRKLRLKRQRDAVYRVLDDACRVLLGKTPSRK